MAFSLVAASVATNALGAPDRDADSPGLHASELGADASYFAERDFGTSIVLMPWVRIAIPRSNIGLDFETPLTVAGETFALGNPGVGAHVDLPLSRVVSVRVGAAVHLPVASLEETNASMFALSMATDSRALLDIDRWAPGYLPMTAPIELELHPLSHLFVRALAETQVYLPFGPSPTSTTVRELRAVERGRIEIEGRSKWGIGGGLDVHAVTSLTNASFFSGHPFEVSVEPYLQFANQAFFVRAGVLVPLSAPLGGFGERASDWSLAPVTTATANVGVRLD